MTRAYHSFQELKNAAVNPVAEVVSHTVNSKLSPLVLEYDQKQAALELTESLTQTTQANKYAVPDLIKFLLDFKNKCESQKLELTQQILDMLNAEGVVPDSFDEVTLASTLPDTRRVISDFFSQKVQQTTSQAIQASPPPSAPAPQQPAPQPPVQG